MNYPNVRESSDCPLCADPKDHGLVCCWTCYRLLGLKYGNVNAEKRIAEREAGLERNERRAVANYIAEGLGEI